MGADIHGYIEFSNGNHWSCWASRISLVRRYAFFGIIAGVRSGRQPIVPLRGIPEDLSWDVIEDYYGSPLRMDELSGHQKAEVESYQAAKHAYIPGVSDRPRDIRFHDERVYLANPDWHSPGWLWREEYRAALKLLDEPPDPCYVAVAHAMEGLAINNQFSVRFCFWFDN